MNHVYNVAPGDGTAIGITIRNIGFDPLFENRHQGRRAENDLAWQP